MEFQLNEKKVRDMAGRMRKVFGNDTLSYAKALETMAQTLGYPNWDTLSGMLKRESARQFKLDTPTTLYVSAFACDEWGESPAWAKVTLDQPLIDAVLSMQQLCIADGLDETSRSWGVEAWGRGAELLLRGEKLTVTAHSWWMQAYPKHADYECQTRMIDIAWLLDAFSTRQSTDFLAWRKDILVYDSSGNCQGLVDELVDDGELDESYLDA